MPRSFRLELIGMAASVAYSSVQFLGSISKNNLQVISSLLNLQSASIKDDQILQAFRESQNRVRSMALIHEKLYQSQQLARIDFEPYVRELTAYLLRSYGGGNGQVALRIDVGGASLTLDTAIPCGLIITELVSNSLKHAFPGRSAGEILVSLQGDGRGQWTLEIRDTGVGLPENLDPRDCESLGLQLVHTLAEQLGGTLEIHSDAGSRFELCFAEPLSN